MGIPSGPQLTSVRIYLFVLSRKPRGSDDGEWSEEFTARRGAACHGLGYVFAPRIRDLKDKKLYVIARPPLLEARAIVGGKVNVKVISSNWTRS